MLARQHEVEHLGRNLVPDLLQQRVAASQSQRKPASRPSLGRRLVLADRDIDPGGSAQRRQVRGSVGLCLTNRVERVVETPTLGKAADQDGVRMARRRGQHLGAAGSHI